MQIDRETIRRHRSSVPNRGVRKKRLETPLIGVKPVVDPTPRPTVVPTLEEVHNLLTQHRLVDAARGLSALLGRCASDVPAGLARAFVDQAAPALRRTVNGLRNGNRATVKVALDACVRRLGGELKPEPKEQLKKDLHQWGLSGTADRHL